MYIMQLGSTRIEFLCIFNNKCKFTKNYFNLCDVLRNETSFLHAFEKMEGIADSALEYAQKFGQKRYVEISTMYRIVKSYFNPKKKPFKIPITIVLQIILSFLYFISPIDLIPDIFPFIGFIDDFFVIGFVYVSISQFVDMFLRHEKLEKDIEELSIQNDKYKERLERSERDYLCCVCLEETIQVLLRPCSHANLCSKCVSLLTDCPICRTKIKGHKLFYLN